MLPLLQVCQILRDSVVQRVWIKEVQVVRVNLRLDVACLGPLQLLNFVDAGIVPSLV